MKKIENLVGQVERADIMEWVRECFKVSYSSEANSSNMLDIFLIVFADKMAQKAITKLKKLY